MLATWWDQNMHGRRLVGHLAQLAAVVILIFAIGGSAEFDWSRDSGYLTWLAGPIVVGSVIEAIQRQGRQAAMRLLGWIVIGCLFAISVFAVDAYAETSSLGWSMSGLMTPALMLVVVVLAGAGAYLKEEDAARRPRTLLVVAGLGFVSFATFLSTTGGPLQHVGVAMLLIAGAGIVAALGHLLATTPPAFPGPGER